MHGKSELEKVFKKPEWNCHLCDFKSHNKGYRTFQPQYSTLDFSTPDFSILNSSTPDPYGVTKFMVENSGVEMWGVEMSRL